MAQRMGAGGQSFSRGSCLETRTGGREHNVITDGVCHLCERECALHSVPSMLHTNKGSKWAVM